MSAALTLFNQPKIAIPAHISSFFGEETNITDRVTVPSLGYEGKVWTIAINGEKTKLTKRNDEGDEEPLATMRVVLLDYAKRRGRTYYEGAYDPNKIGTPVCWSEDGVTPHTSVKEPQASKCEGCPMSVKGSKITEQGKPTAACSQHRMVAVVPANNLGFTPLRMKLAITSDYDKQSPELEAQGWFAFSNYTDMLRTKGVQHTASLVTKMKFDPNAAYPKVMFSPDRWLEPAELAQVSAIVKSEQVTSLLAGQWSSNGRDGTPMADAPVIGDAADDAPVAAPAAPKAAPKPSPKAAPAPKAPKPSPKAVPTTAPTMMMDDDDDETTAPAPAAAPAAAPAISTTVPDDVASLLAEWGEDD